jgi:DNA-binding LytR/AlgR family response regulator
MIDVIIADDEQPARQRIRQLLDDFPNFSVVAEVNNGDELVTSVITHKPQVVFLDINMPGTSVFTSMESIKDPPLILFQTAYPQYALDAFGVDAIDYLVKPVSRERFARAIEKVTRILDGTRISSDSPATSPVDEVKKKTGIYQRQRWRCYQGA